MYNIDDLETFVLIANLGSVTSAAKTQGISAATASHRLSKLEKYLNVSLFHRSSRKIALTNEGEVFYEHVSGILEALNEAEMDIGARGGRIKGHLRVTLAPWILERFILPNLVEFRAKHPDLSIEFLAVDRLVRLVEEGVDCAIRVGELKSSGLKAQKIRDNHRILCASPDYLDAHGTPHSIDELKDHSWICLPWQQEWLMQEEDRMSLVKARKKALLVSNSDLLTKATLLGLGIAIKSRLAISDEIKTKKLIEILPGKLTRANAPISMVRSPNIKNSSKVDTFFTFIRTCFENS